MANFAPSHNIKGKFVEQQINRLAVLQSSEEPSKTPPTSPWRDSVLGQSKVRKLSEWFEKRSTNKVITKATSPPQEIRQGKWDLTKQRSFPTFSNTRASFMRENSIESPAKTSKLEKIIEEILQKELTYIQALERGIELYLNVIRQGGEEVPKEIRHQTFRLFGNIEEIYVLHKNSVYPRLSICRGNVKLFAETISSFIKNELFYCYIVYAINHKSADQLITTHHKFFDAIRNSSQDFLGINSFIIRPIQKLPSYELFFDQIIKELSKDFDYADKDALAAVCVAGKNIQRLLSRLNEALAINDIIEIHEYSAAVQMNIVTTMQMDFGVNINEHMMLLVPRTSSNFPFRTPFNVYSLGRFLKSATLKVQESRTRRTFNGKIFVFEKCLMYTKIINNNTLGYRNHFAFNSGFGFFTKDCPISFRISGVSKESEVLFSSNNIERIVEIKNIINQFYDPRRSADSAFGDGNELMICEDQDLMSEDGNEMDQWVVADAEMYEEQTVKIANSRFFIKSPEPDFK